MNFPILANADKLIPKNYNTSNHLNNIVHIFEKKIDKLFTFGVAAEQIGVGARRAGMRDADVSGNLELFSPLKSAEAVAEVLRDGDILLIRIGRQNQVAEIVEYLNKRFEK